MTVLKCLALLLFLKLAAADFVLDAECEMNCGESGDLVNASQPVQLWCKCTGSCVGVKYHWYMGQNDENRKSELTEEDTLGLSEQRLVIRSDVLMPKDSYEIFCEGIKSGQTEVVKIPLEMHPCSSLYPCEETTTTTTTTLTTTTTTTTTPTTTTPTTTTPTTTTIPTTTTVQPNVLLANITSAADALSGLDVNSPEFHAKQQELLDALKKLSYDDPRVVQQAANAVNKIISAGLQPDTAETSAAVIEDLVNAELQRIAQSESPAALAPEVQQLTKVFLDTLSRTVNDNASQLVAHRTTETPVSSGLDVGVYTESYPAYDDFDLEYQQRKASMQAVSDSAIKAVNNVALTNARTMPTGQTVEQIIESDVCLLVIVQKPTDIPNEPFEICNATLHLPVGLRTELAAKTHIASITFGVLRKNPFWWSLKNLSTDVITLEVRDDDWQPMVTRIKHPVLFQAQLKPVPWPFVAGSVRNTSAERDGMLCVHQVLVHQATKTVMVEFKDLQSADAIQVVIYKDYSPSLEDFGNSFTIPSNQSYTIIRHISASPGSFIYIGVRPVESPDGEPRYVNYSVHCASVSCVRWDPKHTGWLEDYCTVGPETNTNRIQCSCAHLSTFAGVSAHMENKVHRMLAVDVQLTRVYNYTVLATVAMVTLCYVLVLIVARWLNTRRAKPKRVLFLLDNHLKAMHEYLVVVYTGARANAGTTANIGIKLHGTRGETENHLLRGPVEPVLQTGGEDWFLLLVEDPLGDLTQMDLWTDCYGVRSSWYTYCARVLVHHRPTNRRWTFKFNRWLSVLNNNTGCSAAAESAHQHEPSTRWDYARLGVKEHHLWLTVFSKAKSSAYAWREKATLVYAVTLVNMFVSFLCYAGTPPTVDLLGQLGAGHYAFGSRNFGIACLSACLAFAASCAYVYLFTHAVPLRPIASAPSHRFTLCRAWRCLAWFSLGTAIALSLVMLVTFGFWFGQVTSLIWLTTAGVAVVLGAVVLETARVVCMSVARQELPNLAHLDAPLDMSQVQLQKHTLLRRHGEASMRPLFQRLYLPLSEAELKLKREQEMQRVELRHILVDIVMFAVYLAVLFCAVLVNRDSMAHLSTKTVRDMFVEDTFGRHMSLHQIDSVDRFFMYMRTTFVSAACAHTWYGNWTTTETGLTADFNTKVLGVPRIRQLRIRNDSCTVPEAMRFVAQTCHAEFSSDLQCTEHFGQRWQPPGTNTSGRQNAVWLYQDGWQSQSARVTGQLAYYPAGGYVAELGRTRQNMRLVLAYLRDTHWVDHLTRALFVDVNCYNANQNLFNVLTLIVETSATGKFLTSYSIHTSKLLFHDYELAISTSLTFTLLAGVVLVFAWKRLKQLRKRCVADAWNGIDVTIILLAFAFLLVFHLRSQAVGQLLHGLEDAAHNEFVSFAHALAWDTWTTVLATLLVAISTVRAWKLLRFLRFFRICELTLALATKYLLAMAVSKGIVLFAYGAWGHAVFGAHSRDFASVFRSCASLILLSLGFGRTFDYTALDRSYIGYVYYFSFMIVLLAVINIYITIILVAYKSASDYYDASDAEQLVSYNMAQYLRDEVRWFTHRTRGREVLEPLRAGADVEVIADGSELRHRPDAPRDVVKLDASRMRLLHRVTAKVLQLLVQRYERRPAIATNPNDDALVADVLEHLLGQTEPADETGDELYIVVPGDNGQRYCSKRRQDDMLVIVNHLLAQCDVGGGSEHASRAPGGTAMLAAMNHRVDRLIKRIDEASSRLVREFGTQARFEDFGLEVDESSDDIGPC